jgi:hypothetical protein
MINESALMWFGGYWLLAGVLMFWLSFGHLFASGASTIIRGKEEADKDFAPFLTFFKGLFFFFFKISLAVGFFWTVYVYEDEGTDSPKELILKEAREFRNNP